MELHHLTCCDDDTAICGVDVTGQDWCHAHPHTRCEPCHLAVISGQPCTIPGCDPG